MNDVRKAAVYNLSQLGNGKLSGEHLAVLAEYWQAGHELTEDGQLGPRTIEKIDEELKLIIEPYPVTRCYPIKKLADGRQPTITSRYWTNNPDRSAPDKRHRGLDLFFKRLTTDPRPSTALDGDSPEKNWFIPDGTHAVAAADGEVMASGYTGNSRTGFRTWISHGACFTGYFHLKNLVVTPGQIVKMGDPLGVISDNPVDHDARHLHFEVYVGDLSRYPYGSVDPEQFLRGAIFT